MTDQVLDKLYQKPVTMTALYAALLVAGIVAFHRVPLELVPTVELPTLAVHTLWPGASAEVVEAFVTAPIEELVSTVRGVKGVRSVSREGRSAVTVEFEPKTRMNITRLQLNEMLALFIESAPRGVRHPVVGQYVPRDVRDLQGFLVYSLSGGRSASALHTYVEENVAPQLLSLRGIARVEVLGGAHRELQLDLDLQRLAALGLSAEKVVAALRATEVAGPVGTVESSTDRVVVTISYARRRLDDVAHCVIAWTDDGTPVRLFDVGTIRDGTSEEHGYFRVNGKPSVIIRIDKEPRINTIQTANAVFGRLASIAARLPPHMNLVQESNKSQQMQDELGRLSHDVIFSIVSMWLVLLVFQGNARAPVMLLSSILFSVAGTLVMFWFLGIGLHLLTVAGIVLAFGRLVDDSIVVMDYVQRWPVGLSKRRAVACAVREVSLAVFASTLATVGALVPIAFLPPDLKLYFLEFGIAVAVALLVSLLVSCTFIPTIMTHVSLGPSPPWVVLRLGNTTIRMYTWLLGRALQHKRLVLLTAVGMLGLPVWLLPERMEGQSVWAGAYNMTLGSKVYTSVRPYVNHLLGGASHLFFRNVTRGEVRRYEDDAYLVAWIELPIGTGINRYDQLAAGIEREALSFGSCVKKVTARVLDEYATVRIDFSDSAAATGFPHELKNRLTTFAAQSGGTSVSVSGFGPGFSTGGESDPSFSVKVYGYSYTRVKEIADRLRMSIEKNPRIADVDVDRATGRREKSYEVVARVDRDAVAERNLTVASVVRAIRMHAGGSLQQSYATIEGNRVPYSVKYIGHQKFSTLDLQLAVASNPSGEAIRLSELISVERRRAPSEIARENQQYMRWISFKYKGPSRFGEAFVDATLRAFHVPRGYKVERSLPWVDLSDSNQQSMLWSALLGLVIVFMVTASLYESFQVPFVVIVAVPFSLVGLFLAFYLTQTPFGKGGYASVVLLVGIAVTNSIVLVDSMARRIAEKGATLDVLIESAAHRVRPVLMTTLTTVGGLLPLLFLGEHSSIWYSLALGTTGGLLSSTVLTLIIIPVAFAVVRHVKRRM